MSANNVDSVIVEQGEKTENLVSSNRLMSQKRIMTAKDHDSLSCFLQPQAPRLKYVKSSPRDLINSARNSKEFPKLPRAIDEAPAVYHEPVFEKIGEE